jgi:hypothetical protein
LSPMTEPPFVSYAQLRFRGNGMNLRHNESTLRRQAPSTHRANESMPRGRHRPTASSAADQLCAAIGAKHAVLPARHVVLGVAAPLSANAVVHDPATSRAMANGGVRPSMIQVLAEVGSSRLLHFSSLVFGPARSRIPSRIRFRFPLPLTHGDPETGARRRATIFLGALPFRCHETRISDPAAPLPPDGCQRLSQDLPHSRLPKRLREAGREWLPGWRGTRSSIAQPRVRGPCSLSPFGVRNRARVGRDETPCFDRAAGLQTDSRKE